MGPDEATCSSKEKKNANSESVPVLEENPEFEVDEISFEQDEEENGN